MNRSSKSYVSYSGKGTVRSHYSLNQTGCVGISVVRSASGRRDGTMQTYFSVHARKANGKARNRKFCTSTLGRPEAWRRALKFRAQHETEVRGRRSEVSISYPASRNPEPVS
jgi:hypothetical protein